MPRFPNPAGAYAEYITAPARQLAGKPLNLDHAHAAAVPVAGLTAWQVLVDTAGVGPGHRVVIHGAAGGVGHLAVQIAKARGAHVIATGRRDRRRFLERLGADEVLDAGRVDFTRAVRDVDMVFDLVGGEDAARSMAPLRHGGMLIPMATGGLDLRAAAAARGVRAVTFLVEPDYASLEMLTGLIVSERMKVEVETILPLAEAPHAHELGERGGRKGKIVLAVA